MICQEGIDEATVAALAAGTLGDVAARSVEAHVPVCAACRRVVDSHLDPARLRRNRAVVLADVAISRPRPVERVLVFLRVRPVPARLIAVAPSLGLPWLAATLIVLAGVLAASHATIPAAAAGDYLAFVPFAVILPLMPMIAVAAVFSPRLDHTYSLAVAAPMSTVRLLLGRAIATGITTIVVSTLVAFALPWPWWLPATLLLPSIALCGLALAAATVVQPLTGAAVTAGGWAVVVAGPAVLRDAPYAAFGPLGQASAALVLAGAVAVIALRRDRFDYLRNHGR